MEIPQSTQRLCCSLSFIAWMERVTAQHKYLHFSLFLAGLLKHTHEQIAFGFVRMGEAKDRAGREPNPAHKRGRGCSWGCAQVCRAGAQHS